MMQELFGQSGAVFKKDILSGLMHEFQTFILMNARVLGNGSSLTASTQRQCAGCPKVLLTVFSSALYSVLSFLYLFAL